MGEVSHFDEKAGVVKCETSWGFWYQTDDEIHLEINLPNGCSKKEIKVCMTSSSIDCSVMNVVILNGKLQHIIHGDDSLYTIEDKKLLRIVLAKAKKVVWTCLLADGSFAPDPYTLHEMTKKIDLENFQKENPGMDFSRAVLQKGYDNHHLKASSKH